ncbi:hypothetical protein C0J50_8438 [Silurus asotus]|uniref:Ig-like domain-containing protein n=1 Tax=Silurus asotus TaxID=30991 RepID=A0AAD5B2V8_SILAS|nr:hypothetical protein C0J50_8438 [Silurus asotus]
MWVLTVTILLLCVAAHAAEDGFFSRLLILGVVLAGLGLLVVILWNSMTQYSKLNNNEHHYETIDDTVPPTAAAIPIQTHTEGGNVILSCTNDGKVVWSKGVPEGRQEIITAQRGETPKKHFPDNRFMMFSDFSLYIRNVSVSDSGIYYCNAVPVVNLIITPGEVGQSLVCPEPGQCPNAALGASKEVASFSGPLRDWVKIVEDARFSFPETHSVTGLMDQVSVGAWTGQAPGNKNKFTQATLKSPTYTRLSDREHGASQTTISNPSVRGNEGSSGSRTTAIRIQTHTEGSDVVFYCTNDGKVVWSKGVPEGRRDIITVQRGETPKKLHPDPDNRYMMLGDFSLYIRNVSVSDSGIYYCNAVPVVNLIITPGEGNVSKTTMTSPTSSTRANHSENRSTEIISFNSTVRKSEGTSSTLENVRNITQTPTTSTSVNGSEPEATQTSSSNSSVQNRKLPSVVTTTPVVMVSVLGGVTAVGVFGALLLWKCFFQKKTVKGKKADHIYESMTDVTQTAGSCDGKADGRESVDGMFTMSNVLQLCVCVSLALFITAGAVAGGTLYLPCTIPKQRWACKHTEESKKEFISTRFKNGTVIKERPDPYSRFTHMSNQLQIFNIQKLDSGTYFCSGKDVAVVNVTSVVLVAVLVVCVLAVVTLVLLLVIVFLKFSSRKKPTEGSVSETHTHDADAVTLHASDPLCVTGKAELEISRLSSAKQAAVFKGSGMEKLMLDL